MANRTSFSANPVTFWDQYGQDIEGMGVIALGILVYGLLVNAFYQSISKRIMFSGKMGDRVKEGGFGRGLLYLILFPVVSFLFFLLLSAALMFLSGAEQEPITVFTLAMAIVLAVRMAAYFSEASSHDVAKMLPLGLLGVFLVNFDFSGFADSVRQMLRIFDHLDVVLAYFIIVILAEYLLRIIFLIVKAAGGGRKPPKGRKAVTSKSPTPTPGRPDQATGRVGER